MNNKNIFVACDVSSQKEILDLDDYHEDISGIKIGLQYITQRSPKEIRNFQSLKNLFFTMENFLILKIH